MTGFSHTRRNRMLFGGLALVVLLFAFGCGGDDDTGNGDRFEITVQLDWTPNTNHIGVYVALAKGWYDEAGIDVEILPYTDANPDTIVSNGNADLGFSFPANLIFSRAQDLYLYSVAAVLQRNPTELAVLDSSSIRRPRDFDGRTYAGFGLPYEEPQIKTVVQADGGKGNFDTATLSTAAYEALYEKRADFTEIFTTWEGIEAELRGIKLRTFRYSDFGVPDFPGVVLIANWESLRGEKADQVSKFLQVTRRGYEYAAQNPDAAAQEFIDYLPDGTFPEPNLVIQSTRKLASYFVEPGERWGQQDPAQYKAYVGWMLAQGLVRDFRNNPIKTEADIPGGALFRNELLDCEPPDCVRLSSE
ncbi:MAG TPA: ABC transporter substrate-binding protein [Dehalococcoidia bacterium]|nr:ABC transporter substrate-binding protein [Dehalococcoidia bacterium]